MRKFTMIPDDPTLQNFGLIWRFSDAQKYTQLSAAEFLRFHPLPETESIKQWQRFICTSPGYHHLTELRIKGMIQWPQSVSFRSESKDEEGQVIQNLRRDIAADDSSETLFFWHAELAVKTDWRLFLDHWDDFCYPSDNSNLLVLPSIMKAVAYVEERWYVFNWQTTDRVFAGERP